MTTTTTTKSCAACTHWNNTSAGSDGECRRHAPQVISFEVEADVKFESRFPTTAASDWCGDFSSK